MIQYNRNSTSYSSNAIRLKILEARNPWNCSRERSRNVDSNPIHPGSATRYCLEEDYPPGCDVGLPPSSVRIRLPNHGWLAVREIRNRKISWTFLRQTSQLVGPRAAQNNQLAHQLTIRKAKRLIFFFKGKDPCRRQWLHLPVTQKPPRRSKPSEDAVIAALG